MTEEKINTYKDLHKQIFDRCVYITNILKCYIFEYEYVKEYNIGDDKVCCEGDEDKGYDVYKHHRLYFPITLLYSDDKAIHEYGRILRYNRWNKDKIKL